MAEAHGAPTMKDVAREAGVALGTVSKVVNGKPVGEAYRLRVEAAIKKLDYHLNSYAKGLKSGKTMTVAVIMPNLVNPFFASMVNCISKALSRRKYRMLYFSSDHNPDLEQKYVWLAEQQKVDGIICLSYNPKLQVSPEVPMVSIDRYFGSRIPCVAADNYGGGWMAAEKLVELGCKHIAMLRIGSLLPHEPNKRRDGFVAACEAMGIAYDQKILHDGDSFQGFVDYLHDHVHDGKLDFDGLFCVTDGVAYQMRRILQEMGLSVPEDVQMIGFDGTRHFGDLELICSTIVQPVEAMAETCVDLVLSDSRGQAPSLICLPVHYEPGGTTLDCQS